MSPHSCSLFFSFIFLARFIAAVSIVSISLVCDSSIVATCPSISAARFAFCLCLADLFLLFVLVLSGEPRQKQGQGLVDRKLVQAPPPPVILVLAVPRRLFCFGSLVVLDVVFRYLSLCLLYIIGKNIFLMLD